MSPDGGLQRRLEQMARTVALAGGLLLVGVMGMTVVSVLGRYLFNAPIPGDYEITELACGVVAFAFFPYCRITNANIVVELFTGRMPPRWKAALDAVHEGHVRDRGRPDRLAPVRRRPAQAGRW